MNNIYNNANGLSDGLSDGYDDPNLSDDQVELLRANAALRKGKKRVPLYLRLGAVKDICLSYADAFVTVEQLAEKYGVTVRTIQRTINEYGHVYGVKIRTVAEANKVTAKLKDYSALRKNPEDKVKRKFLPNKVRYQVLLAHPFCAVCKNDAKLQVDHIDNNPRNNELSNLQVLCADCNSGKAWSSKEKK